VIDCLRERLDFEAFWARIRELLSGEVEVETLSARQVFRAVYDPEYDEVVAIPASTKVPRHISQSDFLRVWEKFRKVDRDPYRAGHYQRETRNASYILALMRLILGKGEDEKEVGQRRFEPPNLRMLKEIKGSYRGIVKSSWRELEEKTERLVREGRI